MLYGYKHGQSEKTIVQQCAREGLPLPKSIQDAPELHFGLQIYLDAFFDLSTCRMNSFEIGRLTWLMVDDYCRRQGLDEEQTEDMQFFIRKMDDAYVDYQQSKVKKK